MKLATWNTSCITSAGTKLQACCRSPRKKDLEPPLSLVASS
uniref:Uncharacterized protein n=1 Tax=Arundo donax TaxID=35708 RepID=A0A0A8YY36_ARUDO